MKGQGQEAGAGRMGGCSLGQAGGKGMTSVTPNLKVEELRLLAGDSSAE